MKQPDRRSWFSLGCADAVGWLRSLEDESVDLVVTDPPYESLERHRARGTTTRLKRSKASSNDWFQIFPNARFAELLPEIVRVMRPNRHLYLFSDAETAFVVKPLLEAAGLTFWKPLVWDKKRIGLGYHYRSRYELVLFAEKGKRRLADLGVADVLEVPRIHRGHPAEKPVALMEILIRQSTAPGELVCDPFCGAGSTAVAAVGLGRSFVGNDVCETAVEVTRSRLVAAGADERARPEATASSRPRGATGAPAEGTQPPRPRTGARYPKEPPTQRRARSEP